MRRAAPAVAVMFAILFAGCGSGTDESADDPTTTTECSDTLDTTKVPVVAVEKDIAGGTTAEDAIEAGALVEKEIDWGYRPVNAIESLDDMAGGVATGALAPNQLATVDQWGLPTDMTVAQSPQRLCPG